jgi:hypothetical protein
MVGAEREGKTVSACEQDVTVVLRAALQQHADDLLSQEPDGAGEHDALADSGPRHRVHRRSSSSSLTQKSGRESRHRAEGSA